MTGGFHALTDASTGLAPHDLAISGTTGWATLMLGNAIARIDLTTGATTQIPLPACAGTCATFNGFPRPVNAAPQSRQPQSIVATAGSAGDTVLWFTEHGANALGVMQVSPAGQLLSEADLPCGCSGPAGIARAGDGTVWFVAEGTNELIHVVPNAANPVQSAIAQHFALPSPVANVKAQDVSTSLPRGVVVDGQGRVWASETASSKIAFLDAAHTAFTQLPVPNTDFGMPASPQGLALSPNGTVTFVDGLGDMIGTVSTSGVTASFRPANRVSVLTGPVFDSHGNLWVSEQMAQAVTRFTPAPTSLAPATPAPATPAPATAPAAPVAAKPLPGKGYWMTASDGGVFNFGDSGFFGSTGSLKLNKPIVAMAPTPSHKGYWLVASDGGVFSFGDARFFGSAGAIKLNQPVVAMAATPTGQGYWLVASDGGVFSFGDAHFRGSAGAIKLNKPVVTMAPTPSGHGYWLVASDGGVFTFGDARFFGSTGAIKLNKPVVATASTPSGQGYWLVASDGGVFAFGDAGFRGSTGATKLNQPIVAMAA